MENKEVITSQKMTKNLILNFIPWGITFSIVYFIIYSLISKFIETIMIQAIVVIVLQGICVFATWKVCTKLAFKSNTISYDDVPTVMKNLFIFTVVICALSAISNFSNVDSKIDKAINSDYILKYKENRISYLYNDEQMEEYQKQKEKEIKEIKKEAYMYLAIIEIGLTAVYLAVLPLEKKEILKYVG